MSAFERKCVHDVINALSGVESESRAWSRTGGSWSGRPMTHPESSAPLSLDGAVPEGLVAAAEALFGDRLPLARRYAGCWSRTGWSGG